jgi:broad specificity phosphatase PhoE
VRALELRRHAPRDPDNDRLSSDGEILAERVGTELPGPYDAVFTSPARRAAETAAWFLRGLGQPVPAMHGVAEGLASEMEDRWRAAAKAAGSSRLDSVERVDPDLVEKESSALADTIRRLIGDLPEGARGLGVGHSPLIEAAVYGLLGTVLDPLKECEGVLLVEEESKIRLEQELRLA